MHGHADNATSCEIGDLHLLLNESGQHRLLQFLISELAANRLLSRSCVERKSAAHLLGGLLD